MGRLREALLRTWALFARRSHAGKPDLLAELEFHREMLEAELRRQGLGDEPARREARLRLGGRLQIAESYADQRSLPAIESILQDARYALRSFTRAPAFTVASLLTLALGIGATTAIFTVVNAVLLRPLPYPNADRLTLLSTGGDDTTRAHIGFATYADIRDRNRSLAGLAAVRSWFPTLVTTEAERLSGMRVSWNYFSMLGSQPAIGRSFRKEDDHPDRYRVVVLSDGLWRRRFGADPGVIGRAIQMNGEPFEVIGVMPPEFEDVIADHFYQPAEIWAALGYDASLAYACRGCQHLKAVGLVRPGVTVSEAASEVASIRSALAREYPTEYPRGSYGLVPLKDAVSGAVREPLLVLLTAVGFVLLIACANVANLLLARAMNRGREMAVRAALGAGRRRLVRQMVTESLLLWVAGGIAGLAIGAFALRLLIGAIPAELPRAAGIAIDMPVLLFSLLVSVTTGIAFGLLPALTATRSVPGGGLASGSRGSIGGPSRRLRQTLVVVNLAVALVLLVGAGLMLKSIARVLDLNPGFSTERVLTAQFSLVGEAYREDAAVEAFSQRLIERLRTLPGIEAVAIAGQIPMGGNGDRFGIRIEGLEAANPAQNPSPERYSVTPDYFRVMQIPLLRGRVFQEEDRPSSEPVMLVSDTAARTLFRGRDPIGRRVRVGGAPSAPWRTIVGIVGDVRHADLTEKTWPQMYLPQSQFTDSFLVLTVKAATREPSDLVPAIRAALREQDPAVPLHSVALLEDLLAKSIARRQFLMQLLVGFAGVSLLLAAVGLYGVISYGVAQRTREVGVRVALGARRTDIFRLVLGSGASTVGIGVLIGLAVALAVTRFLEGQLFEVKPLDPTAIGAATAVLCVVAVAAHLPPIRRALRIDPTEALRQD